MTTVVTIGPSREIQNLNSPITSTNRNPTNGILNRRSQYPIFPLVHLPRPNPRFIQPILPNHQVILPPCGRLRFLRGDEMAARIKADEAPCGERAVSTGQVPRLHPESFPVAPYDEITARRWDEYDLRRSRWQSTWAIRRLGTPHRLLLLLATQFSLRRLLSRSDGFREKIIFPNGVTVDGGDSHENSDWIKLPSASFLLGHLMDDDNSLPRRILNMQKSSKSACTLNRASTFIKLWSR
jgi:hypothetical protein